MHVLGKESTKRQTNKQKNSILGPSFSNWNLLNSPVLGHCFNICGLTNVTERHCLSTSNLHRKLIECIVYYFTIATFKNAWPLKYQICYLTQFLWVQNVGAAGGSGLESLMRFWPRCCPGSGHLKAWVRPERLLLWKLPHPLNHSTSKWLQREWGLSHSAFYDLVWGATQHRFHHIHLFIRSESPYTDHTGKGRRNELHLLTRGISKY